MITGVGAPEFARQLHELGFSVGQQSDFLVFAFTVPLGSRVGEVVRLGLQIPADFPATPPTGPHVCPRINHPSGAVHASPLGSDWAYWSRPFPNWPRTDRTASSYLAHVRALFAQL
ncbi:MAG: hypothetical protein M0027_12520 [Candidatus Dormibacteraeota bacterium]|nr:hypothetical protein [Candidatus Dormibacteraeota bacterium]